jgi:hypothetical protein
MPDAGAGKRDGLCYVASVFGVGNDDRREPKQKSRRDEYVDLERLHAEDKGISWSLALLRRPTREKYLSRCGHSLCLVQVGNFVEPAHMLLSCTTITLVCTTKYGKT